MSKTLICIVGPTGIGKTDLSLRLGEYLQTEIISADSRQFFREIPIGTAAPTTEELHRVKHHFIHHKSICESYNVGDYEKDAIKKISELHRKYDDLIVVGGSGLYINALTHGLDEFPEVSSEIREELNNLHAQKGLPQLTEELKKLDPKIVETIDLNNPQRVIRALGVCRVSGLPYSSFLNRKKTDRQFTPLTIGLTADREMVYQRINLRVDQMIKNGLIEEARAVYLHRTYNALNTVGYKELFQYFDNYWTLDFAISEIKKNSRRYAKRQFTWFHKQPNVKWFDYEENFETIASYVDSKLLELKNSQPA